MSPQEIGVTRRGSLSLPPQFGKPIGYDRFKTVRRGFDDLRQEDLQLHR